MGFAPESQVRTRLASGGSGIRTLGPPATVELGSAGGARRDRCHPGTPIVRVDKLGDRFSACLARLSHGQKPASSSRSASATSSIWRRLFRLLGNVRNL